MSDLVSIKGGKEGLRVQIDAAAAWIEALAALNKQLEEGRSFFAGAKLVFDIGERVLDDEQLRAMLALVQGHGLQADALNASARESRNAARLVGLTARPLPRYETAPAPASNEPSALLVARTVRSGQVVRHHGHITLLGDVNPGAEVIATGSIVVWGRLRGFVHAGALGDRAALVCAIELRPTQLRIADQIARTPDGQVKPIPEIARIEQDQIVVETWESHRRG